MPKSHGLILNFKGAPETPHTIPGIPGTFRTTSPTPVGEDCPISLADAKKLAKEHDILQVVEVDDPKAAAEVAAADVEALRTGLAGIDAQGAEVELAKDQQQSVRAAS